MATQKNRNLTVYTHDAKAAAKALTAIAAALRIKGQRGPSPSELVSWLVVNQEAVVNALKPVRSAEMDAERSELHRASG